MKIVSLIILGVLIMGIWKYIKKIINIKNEMDDMQPTLDRLEQESKNAISSYETSFSTLENTFNSYSAMAENIVRNTIEEQNELKTMVSDIVEYNKLLYIKIHKISELFKQGNITIENEQVIELINSINQDIEQNKLIINKFELQVKEKEEKLYKSINQFQERGWEPER